MTFKSASHARVHRELDKNWKEIMDRYRPSKLSGTPPKAPTPFRRINPPIPSLDTGVVGAAAKKENDRYTGHNIIGIATMHKSNAIPVFEDQMAKDVSAMRR